MSLARDAVVSVKTAFAFMSGAVFVFWAEAVLSCFSRIFVCFLGSEIDAERAVCVFSKAVCSSGAFCGKIDGRTGPADEEVLAVVAVKEAFGEDANDCGNAWFDDARESIGSRLCSGQTVE